jgi:lysozyme
VATFQGKRVSKKWRVILLAAGCDGVDFQLNSGRRTLREQWALWRLWKAGKGNLAAFPSPFAPHIRKGFPNHALDVSTLDGGETRLERWVESHGVNWRNTVPGEAWHGELSLRGLNRLYNKVRPRATRTSRRGRKFLTREEGVVRWAYADPIGWATFGVGHLIQPQHKGVTAKDRLEWGSPAKPKSLRFVNKILREDLKKYEQAVRDSVKVPLKQHQFDACVSLCFNVGTAGFARSTVVRELNQRHFKRAADAFLLWNKPSMLIPRRNRERALFTEGKYA